MNLNIPNTPNGPPDLSSFRELRRQLSEQVRKYAGDQWSNPKPGYADPDEPTIIDTDKK